MQQTSATLDNLDISERAPLQHFDVRIAETQGRRGNQEDAFFVTSPNARPSNEMPGVLREIFKQTQQKIDDIGQDKIPKKDGAATTVAAISTDDVMTVAHAGDAPLTMFVMDGKTGKVTAHSFIEEHNVYYKELNLHKRTGNGHLSEEQMAMGNRAAVQENYNLAALTHSVGHPGLNHLIKEPDIQQINLKEMAKPGDRMFLCSSCDGLFESKSPEEMAAIVEQELKSGNANNLADALVKHAYNTGSQDNITAIVTEIEPSRERDLVIGIADGHGGRQSADIVATTMKQLVLKPTHDLMPAGWTPESPNTQQFVRSQDPKQTWGNILVNGQPVINHYAPESGPEADTHGPNFVQEIAQNIGNFINRLRHQAPEQQASQPITFETGASPAPVTPAALGISPDQAGSVLNKMSAHFPGSPQWIHQDSLAGQNDPHFRIGFQEPAVAELLSRSFSDAGITSYRAEKNDHALVIIKDTDLANTDQEKLAQAGRSFHQAIMNRTENLLNQATENVPGAEWKRNNHANGKTDMSLQLQDPSQTNAVFEKLQNANIPSRLVPIRNAEEQVTGHRIVVLQDNYPAVTEPASRYVGQQLEMASTPPPRPNIQPPRPGMR